MTRAANTPSSFRQFAKAVRENWFEESLIAGGVVGIFGIGALGLVSRANLPELRDSPAAQAISQQYPGATDFRILGPESDGTRMMRFNVSTVNGKPGPGICTAIASPEIVSGVPFPDRVLSIGAACVTRPPL